VIDISTMTLQFDFKRFPLKVDLLVDCEEKIFASDGKEGERKEERIKVKRLLEEARKRMESGLIVNILLVDSGRELRVYDF
jgi:hypothetical protein